MIRKLKLKSKLRAFGSIGAAIALVAGFALTDSVPALAQNNTGSGFTFKQVGASGQLEQVDNPSCGSTIFIYLDSDQAGVKANGLGNSMSLVAPDMADAFTVTCPSGGGIKLHPYGFSTHCVEEADTSHDSTVIVNPCDSSIARQVWTLACSFGRYDWVNNWDSATVYTLYESVGSKVRFKTGNLPSGSYSFWDCSG